MGVINIKNERMIIFKWIYLHFIKFMLVNLMFLIGIGVAKFILYLLNCVMYLLETFIRFSFVHGMGKCNVER